MTKSTRYFLLGSLATLGVGLGTGLVAYYSGLPIGALAPVYGPAELRYVPRDATVVAYANVRDVMNSELRRRLKEFEPQAQDSGREEFQRMTGIDIENDVDAVVVCMTPDSQSTFHGRGLALVSGRFNEVQLETLARDHGALVEDYRGKRLITRDVTRPDSQPAGRVSMAFVSPGLVAFGTDPLVRRAVDVDQGGQDQNVTDNAELMKMIRELEDGNAWAVGRFDTIVSQARLPAEMTSRMPPITIFGASGRINGGISGVVKAETRDAQSARDLGDVARGFMALAKLQVGSRPELQSLLSTLQLQVDDTSVSLSFSLPADVLEFLAPKKPAAPPQ